jgi:hypothetical protein
MEEDERAVINEKYVLHVFIQDFLLIDISSGFNLLFV